MFNKKSADTTDKQKLLTESNLLDSLSELATDRHFKEFLKNAPTYYFSECSTDETTVKICEALVKELEHEIWQRIAPKMLERVSKMKDLSMEATGEHQLL